MKSFAVVLTLLLASTDAFAPSFATRAVGAKVVAKPAAKKVVAKPAAKVVAKPAAKVVAKKVVAKKEAAPVAKKAAFSNPFAKKEAAPVAKKAAAKPVAKKVVAKKVVAKKEAAPVAKKAAFSNPFAKKEAAPVAKKVAAKSVVKKVAPKRKVGAPKPAFKLPSLTGRTRAKPSINFQMPSTTRSKKLVDYVIDDGLTVIERKQRGDSTASFLTGSAKSRADKDLIRDDVVVGDEYYFSPFDTTLVAVVSLAIISVIVKAGSP